MKLMVCDFQWVAPRGDLHRGGDGGDIGKSFYLN